MQLLVAQQVDHSWEWDAVLRATVSQPAYRGVEGGMPRRKAPLARLFAPAQIMAAWTSAGAA